MKKVIWDSLENSDQSKTLKQHGFIEKECGGIWADKYMGNTSLCGRIGAHDGSKYIALSEFNSEDLNEEKACKRCLKIFNNMS